ncbi:uncharacterized protein LOC126853348 isoform X2 [Cataglyphis hispanica]|uniref:uncharacterized protein LOC126853348 isoform X2 n=1 Tax=Cataglyphis hispanica TaxID=1086592 RepID=UPI00218097F1|nr:uncharacterized protein LOC126853348 isoform X2 [Cataglyphis hispanica]
MNKQDDSNIMEIQEAEKENVSQIMNQQSLCNPGQENQRPAPQRNEHVLQPAAAKEGTALLMQLSQCAQPAQQCAQPQFAQSTEQSAQSTHQFTRLYTQNRRRGRGRN